MRKLRNNLSKVYTAVLASVRSLLEVQKLKPHSGCLESQPAFSQEPQVFLKYIKV
jgi:hypothetical protein